MPGHNGSNGNATPGDVIPPNDNTENTMDVSTIYPTMKIIGTNRPYSGRTVTVGGSIYSTVGGTIEGFSVELEKFDKEQPSQPEEKGVTPRPANPVVENFNAPSFSVIRYQTIQGATIPEGAPLHRHADGTIMTGHVPTFVSTQGIQYGTHGPESVVVVELVAIDAGKFTNENIENEIRIVNPGGNVLPGLDSGLGGGTGGGTGGGGGGTPGGPQPNPNPGMSGQSNPLGGKTGPGQGGPVGGY